MMQAVVIPLLAFVATVSLGGAWLTARAARRQPIRARLGGDRQLPGPAPSGLGGLLRRDLERLAARASVGSPSARLRSELAKAGYYGQQAAQTFLGLKLVLFGIGVAGLGIALAAAEVDFSTSVILAAGGGTLLSFIPNLVVRAKRARRSEEIRRHLPDALDLLEICVSSGMGVDMAWNAVADEVRGVSGTLADEIALTNLDLHLGAPRQVAMRRMAERTGAQELASLVAVLVQSERFGTSVGDALRTFAGSMRETRSQRAAEAAEKTTVKLLFPMVLFIFPAILVVAVGPACIVLARALGW